MKKKTRIILIFMLIFIFVLVLGLFAYKHRKVLKKCYDGINIPSEVDCIIKNYKSHRVKGKDKIPVLTFHRIMSDNVKKEKFPTNEWAQSVDVFEQQMKYLYDNGYKTLSMDEFYCWYNKKCKYDEKNIVLTFDDGDVSIYYLVLPILKKYNFKATAFIVGANTENSIDEEFDENKRQFITEKIMTKSLEEYPNLEYQSHSYNYHDSSNKNRIYNSSKEEIQKDFDKNKKYNFKYIAYPYGYYNKKLLDITKHNNYKLGFTFGEYRYATRDSLKYEIPRIKVNGYSDVDYIKKVVEGNFVRSDIVAK